MFLLEPRLKVFGVWSLHVHPIHTLALLLLFYKATDFKNIEVTCFVCICVNLSSDLSRVNPKTYLIYLQKNKTLSLVLQFKNIRKGSTIFCFTLKLSDLFILVIFIFKLSIWLYFNVCRV